MNTIILSILFFFAALLYSSVGHGGASGYLAVMGLVGIEPALMKPTALCLNILVSSIAFFRFYKAGAFSWSLFIPLALTAIPFAYLGGTVSLPSHIYKPVVGAVLLFAAYQSFKSANILTERQILKPVSNYLLLIVGAGLGLLSGLTGVGGGIFLSPLLLFTRWSTPKIVAGVAAAFIFVNSVSGLFGVLSTGAKIPSELPIWLTVVLVGGFLGATYGSKN
ncbi:sulfite exporter TauE/SafE family protein [Acinetobacter proteolyticus]|uniref:sulfite exporter TauE/SafE family protein n=1 Tax=Acinetobacter proteolyticus TaxID=1776741 RepID=UPI001BC88195|nr:sulfite exporter TauE/SafE family protein [Acinetobacter proteolyticus]